MERDRGPGGSREGWYLLENGHLAGFSNLHDTLSKLKLYREERQRGIHRQLRFGSCLSSVAGQKEVSP